MVYHLVLTYSNWETATVCLSEILHSSTKGSKTPSGNWEEFPRCTVPIGQRRGE